RGVAHTRNPILPVEGSLEAAALGRWRRRYRSAGGPCGRTALYGRPPRAGLQAGRLLVRPAHSRPAALLRLRLGDGQAAPPPRVLPPRGGQPLADDVRPSHR